jgi:hypothetical protein
MSNIKVKIIGSQVWTVENLTKEQYIEITGIDIPIVDSIWENDFPKCCIYETFYKLKIKNYLFDFYAAEELHNLLYVFKPIWTFHVKKLKTLSFFKLVNFFDFRLQS